MFFTFHSSCTTAYTVLHQNTCVCCFRNPTGYVHTRKARRLRRAERAANILPAALRAGTLDAFGLAALRDLTNNILRVPGDIAEIFDHLLEDLDALLTGGLHGCHC